MIVPMKKITLITLEKNADTAISNLRKLGVLHVEHRQRPHGEEIDKLKDNITLVNSAVEIVSANEFYSKTHAGCADKKIIDLILAAKCVVELRRHLEQLLNYSESLLGKISQLENWGDFDPHEIKELAKKNIFVRFYQISLKEKNPIPQDVTAKQISIQGGIANYAVVSQRKIQIPFKEVELPEMGLNELHKKYNETKQTIQRIKNEIGDFVCHYKDFLNIRKSLESELELQQAIRGMGKDGVLVYLVGYVPHDKVESLKAQARKERWGFVVNEPSQEDEVPVLIRNPRWVSIISPIFKFLEILPGYRELDISLPFLIFFSVFFGILIGDAGYGLVYLLLTFLIQRRKKKKDPVFFLFYLLSLCAIIWGALTGTFFGQEWFLKTGYKPLLPVLTEEKGLQRFCFFLGALHLSIAHGWRGILKAPSLSALGDLGWMCILWSAFFIAKTLILGDALPSFCMWLLISGVSLIIIFTNPQKNILKSAEEWTVWLITLPFSFIGNFADVVSYIRLFAVGLAGVAIADAFNAMAAMIGKSNMLTIVFAAFVALIGNTLGLILGPVSVLVHGVRLNLLEFSGHIGLSWSGTAYKPLKEE